MSKTGGSRNHICAFATDQDTMNIIKEFAARHNYSQAHIENGGIDEAVQYLQVNRSPYYLFIGASDSDKDDFLSKLPSLAAAIEADAKVFVFGRINEFKFYQKLMDNKVADYLMQPFTLDDIEKAVAKTKTIIAAEKKSARYISVIGARGGVGATTIASALALCASRNGEKIALVDLDVQAGTVSLDFDLEPSRGFRDALEKPERIDNLYIDRLLNKHDDNLSLISSEENIELDIKYNEKALDIICAELENKFSSIIFDLPRVMRKLNLQALQKSEYLVLVCESGVASLRDAARTAEMTAKHKPDIKIKVVLNRLHISKKYEMPVADFGKHLKRKADFEIPFLPEIYGFANTGKPLMIANAKNKLLEAVELLSAQIYGYQPGDKKSKKALAVTKAK